MPVSFLPFQHTHTHTPLQTLSHALIQCAQQIFVGLMMKRPFQPWRHYLLSSQYPFLPLPLLWRRPGFVQLVTRIFTPTRGDELWLVQTSHSNLILFGQYWSKGGPVIQFWPLRCKWVFWAGLLDYLLLSQYKRSASTGQTLCPPLSSWLECMGSPEGQLPFCSHNKERQKVGPQAQAQLIFCLLLRWGLTLLWGAHIIISHKQGFL